MRLVVMNHVTLDGVMQAPGRADEDTRGGFRHGGWAVAHNDDVMARALGQRMGRLDGGLLPQTDGVKRLGVVQEVALA